eukprot:690619-Ditylum_brightwellii.AAC.1
MEEVYHDTLELAKKKRQKTTKKSTKQSAEEEDDNDKDDWCMANNKSKSKEEDKSGDIEGEEHPVLTDEWKIHIRVMNILPHAKKLTEQLLPETLHAAAH